MKIVDVRSGEVMSPGQTVWYGRGFEMTATGELREIDEAPEGMTYHGLVRGGWKPVADITMHSPRLPGGSLRQQTPLIFRLLHPSYLLQPVGFIPT